MIGEWILSGIIHLKLAFWVWFVNEVKQRRIDFSLKSFLDESDRPQQQRQTKNISKIIYEIGTSQSHIKTWSQNKLKNIWKYLLNTYLKKSHSRDIFLFFSHLFWSINALQCCVSFYCTTKWISYMYTYIPISPPSWASLPPSLSHPSRSSQSTELISPCYAAASH